MDRGGEWTVVMSELKCQARLSYNNCLYYIGILKLINFLRE